MRALRSKILGPLFAAQLAAPRMTAPGSITFTSGIAAYRPAPGGMLAATVNGALESMVRAWRWNSARSASTPCPPAGWTRQSGTSWRHRR